MELIPDWALNIHPILVHFPIALIIAAAGINLLSFFVRENWWDEQKNTLLYFLGAVSVVVAYLSGNAAADTVFPPAEAQTTLNNHSDWALWTLLFFIAYTLARLILHRLDLMERKYVRIIAFLAVFPGLFFLYETGEHGAELVFGYGVGTGQLLVSQEEAETGNPENRPVEESSTFEIADNGDWSWEIGPNAAGSLAEHFQWLSGPDQEVQPNVIVSEDNYLLQFTDNADNNFIVSRENYQNVQLDYYMDISSFEGEVELVNHVHDEQNYDFVTLSSDGTVAQGRVRDGDRQVFEESAYSASGLLFVRVVVNGTHFYTYINREQVTHPHGDAPAPGSVGLHFEGDGTVLLDRMELRQLN